jgi:hypothetical protein
MTYVITIPGDKPTTGLGSDVTAAGIVSALAAAETTFEQVLVQKMNDKGATAYTVTVQQMSAPVITLKTITTTSTMTLPDTEDDSFAFTKVAFSSAHALALLAVSASALSF